MGKGKHARCYGDNPPEKHPRYRYTTEKHCSWHFSSFGCYELHKQKADDNAGQRAIIDTEKQFRACVEKCCLDSNTFSHPSPLAELSIDEIHYPEIPKFLDKHKDEYSHFFKCFNST